MPDHLRESFAEEVKNIGYFSIIVYSSLGVSHLDQLTVHVRYMISHGEISEVFLRTYRITHI
jgi:hypothetical protein